MLSIRSALTSILVAGWGAGALAAQGIGAEMEKRVPVRSDLPCPSPDLYSPVRPDPPGVPTVVGVAVWFEDISQLNDVDQTLTTDVYVLHRWLDKRLANPALGDAAADCHPPGTALWMPTVEADNLRSLQRFYDARFTVDARGMITYYRRSLAQTANPLDFRDFPIDSHRWNFTLWPTFSRSDEVVLHPLLAGKNESLSIQGWLVGEPIAEVTVSERPPRGGQYARLSVFLPMHRNWQYYLWKLGVPLTLIVMMAYGVYFIPASAAAQQIGLGMTSVLTLIAYMLALGGSLPKINYLTRADSFFVGSAILVFLGLAKGVLTLVWDKGGAPERINRANRLGRILLPIGMVLNFANAFLR